MRKTEESKPSLLLVSHLKADYCTPIRKANIGVHGPGDRNNAEGNTKLKHARTALRTDNRAAGPEGKGVIEILMVLR